jgi:Fe-S-cluster containining protein
MKHWLDRFPSNSLEPEVRRIHQEYQRLQEVWLSEHPQIRIYCSPGCGYCCNMSVRVSLLEAIMIREYSDHQYLQMAAAKGMRLPDFVRNYSGDDEGYFYAFRKWLGRCPFLDRRDRCSIHPLRPLSCRAVLSGLPGIYCEAESMESRTQMRLRKAERLLPAGIFQDSPFVLPLIEMAEEQEWRLDRLMIEEWGVAIRGELNFLQWLLDDRKFRESAGSAEFSAVRDYLMEMNFPHFLIEAVEKHSSGQ